jgi:histidine triad (HIT) family protein
MEDCIFCKVARGEISATRVYEDDVVVAFDDISPQAPVHTLVIPKEHFETMGSGVPDETMAALFVAVPEVARLKGVVASGYRVIVNNGPDANQTVHHLHVHVMGGRAMSHGMLNFSDGQEAPGA